MMNGNLFQFDEYPNEEQQTTATTTTTVGDIRDYLTSDLKLSDVALNDLFSEFDLNPNDFPYFDPSINSTSYPQQSNPLAVDLPPSYDTVLLTNNQIPQTVSPVLDEYISSNTLQSLIEQHQAQQAGVKYSSSPPSQSTASTNYHESYPILPLDASSKSSSGRKSSSNKRTRSSLPPPPAVHLPKLIKKPEPIPVTLDQFQALIYGAPDTSTPNAGSFSSLLENSTIIGNNIPLKIINQANTTHPTSSDENSRHGSPTNHQITITTGGSGGGRVRRKSSHNAIEKRYRSSINERILELKEIVANDDEKVQKSGVLRRTVEYIRQLQSTNDRLEEENNTLKSILKRLNLTNVETRIDNERSPADRTTIVKNPSTPPSSHSDCSESTLGSSDEAYSPVPKRQKRTTSKQGMVNGSRLILCCFMLCVLITNPFNSLLNRLHPADHSDPTEVQSIVSSRTLQSTGNSENSSSSTFLSSSWRQLIAWTLNLAICLVCLIKLFVYGEPIVDDHDMAEYYIYKKKADQLMAENQFVEARIYYRQCCEKLYVTIDHTLLYYLSSITWQMTRFCVNLIVVGRWLIYWSGWTNSIDTRDYNRELNDCLLQLWKIEYQHRTSPLALFNFVIATLNTSMNAGKKLDVSKRNEIYFLAILTLKSLGGIFSLFIPSLLKCLTISNLNDYWFNDLERLSEFFSEQQTFQFEPKNISSAIRSQYFQSILHENIHNHLLFQDSVQQIISINNSTDLDYLSWWQHSLQVIRAISIDQQLIDHLKSSDRLRCSEQTNQTIYNLARTMNITDERFILIIETIHSILLVLHDDDQQTNKTRISLLEQLGQTSHLITSLIDQTANENNLDLAIKSLLLDGILSLRLRLLTSILIDTTDSVPYLNDFQQELDSYRQLNQMMKLPKQRLYLFESIFRLASGLNPLTTQTLFERAIKQPNSIVQTKEETPNLDVLSALLLFCHFSPSTIYHYRNLLQQAANLSCSSEKNHDLNRLRHQCLLLIRQPYFTL